MSFTHPLSSLCAVRATALTDADRWRSGGLPTGRLVELVRLSYKLGSLFGGYMRRRQASVEAVQPTKDVPVAIPILIAIIEGGFLCHAGRLAFLEWQPGF